MKLGKKPARPNSVAFKFGAYFDSDELPSPPKVFGHESIGRPWESLGNDDWSCCVFAGAAHETLVWSRMGHGGNDKLPVFTTENVLADYSAVTGFDPADINSDQGTDMQEAASYRRTTGILDASGKRHKIDAYVSLKPGSIDDLALATFLFGACGVGLELPESAMDQLDSHEPWSVTPNRNSLGGHYVPCVGRNSAGNFLVVTWGRLHAMTPDFYRMFCDEAVAYISLEALSDDSGITPEGFDAEALRKDLRKLRA